MSFRGRNIHMMPTRGVDDSQGAQNIGDEYVAAAQNVRFFSNDWKQRGGTAPYVATQVASAAIVGIRNVKFSTGNTRMIVATAAISGSAGLWKKNGSSWTSVKGALTFDGDANNQFAWAELNDVIVGTNGKNQLFKVSDSVDPAVVLGGTPPSKATAIMSFRNRIVTGDGSTVKWCALNNVDNWTANSAGSATPGLNLGQNITALAAVGADAFLFLDHYTFSVNATGDDRFPFRFDEHDPAVGAANQQSVVAVPGSRLLFFANAQGIWRMAGARGYVAERISKWVDGTWAGVNRTRVNKIAAGRLPGTTEVWFACSLGSGSTHSVVMVYDYEREAWNGSFVIAANVFGNYEDSNGDERLVFGDYNGFVNDTETGDQDKIPTSGTPAGVATAIDSFVTSKEYQLVDGRRRGGVWEAEVELDGQSTPGALLEYNFGYDLGGVSHFLTVSHEAPGDKWDQANWDVGKWSQVGRIKKRIRPGGFGQHYQHQLRNRTINTTWRCYGITLGVTAEAVRETA